MGSVPNCRKEIAMHDPIRWFKCKLKPPKKAHALHWNYDFVQTEYDFQKTAYRNGARQPVNRPYQGCYVNKYGVLAAAF